VLFSRAEAAIPQISYSALRSLLVIVVTLAWTLASIQPARSLDSGHEISFADVAPGVRLEVLDWGGSGPTLILLAGLNNTAHVFDAFAPRLTNRFHVRGITRRGFGASSRPADGYDTDTLARDVVVVMNSLAIRSAVLVGHSIAGDELTRVAAAHPDRVQALVYLDAAYDRTTQPQNLAAPDQPSSPDDTRSLDALQARWLRTFGWRLPEDEARAQIVFDAQDRPLRSTVSAEVGANILNRVQRPVYERIKCAALAIYALDTVPSMFPNVRSFDAENRHRAEQQVAALRRWQESSIAQFKRRAEHGRVVTLDGANHYAFLTQAPEVIRLMDHFFRQAVIHD
jgi:non-heme chloroperoxidase